MDQPAVQAFSTRCRECFKLCKPRPKNAFASRLRVLRMDRNRGARSELSSDTAAASKHGERIHLDGEIEKPLRHRVSQLSAAFG